MVKLQAPTRIIDHTSLAPLVKKMIIYVPAIAHLAQPGQFVHMRLGGGHLLRRPISIADADPANGTLTLIYRIVGSGTAWLAQLPVGENVDCLGPLGRGFRLTGDKPLLIGGGMGLAPLLFLARKLYPKPSQIVMGGRCADEMFWPDLFRDVCQTVHITTDDGSLGFCGTAVQILPELLKLRDFDMMYTCGPEPMMEAAAKTAKQYGLPCQVSLEKHMACGVGACLSCTCAAKGGKRVKVCTDGPVFDAEEVFPV